MRGNRRIVWVLALVAAFVPGLAATGQAGTPEGVSYVSGGVGVDSQEQLDARAGEFNLKLVFTLTEGNYVADVNVVVSDAKGQKIIESLSEGPYFMARLPAGRYSVTATYDGKAQSRKLYVGAKGLHTEYLRWPSNPAIDFPLSREQADDAVKAAPGRR